MSASSTPPLHPLIEAAAEGQLPDWTEARNGRRKHMARVAQLLRSWAEERGDLAREIGRWTAVGYLHDILRDADPEEIRPLVEPAFRDYPGGALHGPAAAQRLREEGVEDEELLKAITLHTLGSAEFGDLGMALFAADFLEPGRKFREKWRGDLRRRFPGDLQGVVRDVLAARFRNQLDRGRPLREESVAFWNRITEGKGWASASEL